MSPKRMVSGKRAASATTAPMASLIQPGPPPGIVDCARLLERYAAYEVTRAAKQRWALASRPATLLDELRFFLSVFDPEWHPGRPRRPIGR